jgi:hypothetical protein
VGLLIVELKNCLLEESAVEAEPKRVTVPYSKAVQSPGRYPSRAGHVKPGLNLGGPSPKAKYYLATDSEPCRVTE